ncbi:MAG: type II toxin-antitoxin system RelE/ParE family toxin [Lacunisphaera sp.]
MIQRLVVAPQAEADLRDAFIWYEQRSAGLGRDFLERVEAAFELLSRSPQLFRSRHGPYRLAPTQRFPYSIYFIWDEVHQIVSVRRVLHFKQFSQPLS